MTCESCECSGCSCKIKRYPTGSTMLEVSGDVTKADPECQYLGTGEMNGN